MKKVKEKVKLIYLGPHQVGLPSGTLLNEMPKDASEEVKLLTVPINKAQEISKLIRGSKNQYSDAYKKITGEVKHV